MSFDPITQTEAHELGQWMASLSTLDQERIAVMLDAVRETAEPLVPDGVADAIAVVVQFTFYRSVVPEPDTDPPECAFCGYSRHGLKLHEVPAPVWQGDPIEVCAVCFGSYSQQSWRYDQLTGSDIEAAKDRNQHVNVLADLIRGRSDR